ncbi:MAG: GH3 auxin-responsive promoter family protein [Bacteroidia bacterium]|jgi:hypothetical protein
MSVLNSLISWWMKKRLHQVELFMKYPMEVQNDVFRQLLHKARDTQWGRAHGYAHIQTVEDYRERVPVSRYEDLFPWIERIMKGEQQVLWPTEIRWFAKSSGTTNDRSKFIPVSEEAFEECHFKAGKDMLAMYCSLVPDTQIFSGKGLTIGGSHKINSLKEGTYYGDLSALLMQNLPFWVEFIRTPELSVALLDDWEVKVERIARETMTQDVTNMTGVPTWFLVLFRWILNHTGKSNISEIWPNMEVYFHGGVGFEPYRESFRQLIPSDRMNYMETYNASEGFFGFADRLNSQGEMLLLLDYGIYYEFMDPSDVGQSHPRTYTLDEIELNRPYAPVLSTNAGLWRYLIGDTIRFTQKYPFRFHFSGRTKHYINIVGEEVMMENAEHALSSACLRTGAHVRDYTVAPIFLSGRQSGAHQWLIEFEIAPNDSQIFITIIDEELRSVNSDYDAKRTGDMALRSPELISLPEGSFYLWLKERGKLGGQNKVPRLSNDRTLADALLHSCNQ